MYVFAVGSAVVDFERASRLIDRALLQETLSAMQHERNHEPRWRCG